MRNAKLGASCDDEQWEDGAGNEAIPEPQPSKKQKKKHMGDSTVTITVGNTDVCIFCPAKRSGMADLMVQLDPGMLSAVFTFIKDDCDACSSTRPYMKTGRFRQEKKSKQDDSPADESPEG